MRLLLFFLFIISHFSVNAQTLSYELYQVGKGERKQLASASESPNRNRVKITKQAGNPKVVRREVLLAASFSVGCSDYGEKQPSGFGCWLSFVRSPVSLDQYDGFSWEWYDHGVGALYTKRQGGTKASLKVTSTPEGFEMESLEFLEDTVFRVNMNPKSEPGVYTHELVIKQGSVLLFKDRSRE